MHVCIVSFMFMCVVVTFFCCTEYLRKIFAHSKQTQLQYHTMGLLLAEVESSFLSHLKKKKSSVYDDCCPQMMREYSERRGHAPNPEQIRDEMRMRHEKLDEVLILCVYAYVYMCVYVYVYMCVCVCVCVYIYAYVYMCVYTQEHLDSVLGRLWCVGFDVCMYVFILCGYNIYIIIIYAELLILYLYILTFFCFVICT
jgi:hypothetical protein